MTVEQKPNQQGPVTEPDNSVSDVVTLFSAVSPRREPISTSHEVARQMGFRNTRLQGVRFPGGWDRY